MAASQIVGVTYLPKGTLNLPALFTRYSPLKQVLLRKKNNVQLSIDNMIRVIRENITGVRVIKALSKMDYEKNRFNRGTISSYVI